MTVAMRAFAVVIALGSSTALAGNCPDKRASCVLHEEGVALFLEGKHEQAAIKFAAAIAAEPTARSYLGYAQAVEGLGQIALAYDTLVAAQRLSTAEVQASGGKDVDVNARAERIKYKLGEMRAKIGFVWLRVPDGVPPRRVVAVKRQGEGDLAQPLTQWTAVAPGKQVLVAQIDDGRKIELVAEVAAGSQGVVVIPIAAGPSVRVQPPGGPGGPMPGGPGRPIASLYQPIIKPPPPPVKTYVAVGASFLAPGPQASTSVIGAPDGSSGFGFAVNYERRFGTSSVGLATTFEFLNHSGAGDDFVDPQPFTVSGNEIIMLAGIRTMGSRTYHARVGAGTTIYSQKIEDTSSGFEQESFTRAYPALELGGGLHLGRLRLQMSIMFTASGDASVELGTRVLGTIGVDLFRKEMPAPPPK